MNATQTQEMTMNRNQSLAAYALNALNQVSNPFAQLDIARAGCCADYFEHRDEATTMWFIFSDHSTLLCTAVGELITWTIDA